MGTLLLSIDCSFALFVFLYPFFPILIEYRCWMMGMILCNTWLLSPLFSFLYNPLVPLINDKLKNEALKKKKNEQIILSGKKKKKKKKKFLKKKKKKKKKKS